MPIRKGTWVPATLQSGREQPGSLGCGALILVLLAGIRLAAQWASALILAVLIYVMPFGPS
jgi:hypothetical protein